MSPVAYTWGPFSAKIFLKIWFCKIDPLLPPTSISILYLTSPTVTLTGGVKEGRLKSSAKWFRPVLPVKKAQEKKIWRGECSNVPKKSNSGVGKKKSCVPCACGASMYPTNVDHQQNIFKIGNPSGEPGAKSKKKKKKKKKKNGVADDPKIAESSTK